MIHQQLLIRPQVLRLRLGYRNATVLSSSNWANRPERSGALLTGGGDILQRPIDHPVYYNHSQVALFHWRSPLLKDPESHAEKAVNLIKENIIPVASPKQDTTDSIEKQKQSSADVKVDKKPLIENTSVADAKLESSSVATDEQKKQVDVVRPTLWQRIVKELKHYYDGFKLLGFETKIAFGLLKKVLNGHTLTRRERKQFTRTAADLFRLVPFSVFIIVPFMEFTLPIFLKLFPNMLPSTFQEHSKEQDNLRKRLKAKLEMAKFLQDTLEETSLAPTDSSKANEAYHKFAEFMKKVRSKGEQPTNEDIMKYSALFENELTLDNLNRQQLIAVCQILDVSTLGNIPPNHILRFQLRMKIRSLEADDKVILKEGLDTLTTEELQQACRDRGMRALGVSEPRLRNQLEQWLDLHINRKIPVSLLLLSRALYLPENLPTEDMIKTTIAILPKTIETATIAKIAEATGAPIDNKTKLEVLKQEQAQIKMEADEAKKKPVESPVPAAKPQVVEPPKVEKDFAAEQIAKETLVDKATVLTTESKKALKQKSQEVISPVDIKEINQIIENLPAAEKNQVKAEIEELKKDITEYKEDVKEVEELTAKAASTANVENKPASPVLTETKSAKLLSKKVQKLVAEMDKIMAEIESEKKETLEDNKNMVSIDELVSTIKKLKGGLSTPEKEKKLIEVLQTLDKDKDGKIDDLNDVLRVFDLIEQENVKVTKDELSKILSILEKEKLVEMEETKAQQPANPNPKK